MGLFLFTARVSDLIHRKNELDYKYTRLTRKINDLQSYSATVGNGGVSIGDLLNSPGTMMGRAMNYLAFAHNSSLEYMQMNAPMMQQQMMMMQGGVPQEPAQQQQMNIYIFKSLYEQGRERARQIEERNLHVEEERLQREAEQIKTQRDEVEAELQQARAARDQALKDSAPRYSASA